MTQHDDFALKRALDSLPRSIEPPQDLWPGIRGRLARRSRIAWLREARTLRIAALLAILAGSAGALALSRHRAGTWRVETAAAGERVFAVGESLATAAATARMTVGTIGHVDVDPGTRVRLLAARWSEHRLALERGTIRASITAPPRLFIVETPSGTAVDLGCAYTLEVDSTGNSAIHVTAGWVSFEDRGIESLIPAGMRAATRRSGGIGTPFMDDAPDSLAQALVAFDFAGGGDSALAIVLRTARARDAVTLWHLVKRTQGARRSRVMARLVQLVPPREGLTPGVVMNDPHLMQLYWQQLPGTLPIIPEWQRRMWMLWLRVAG